ncbi:TetR/AcrR family transcriptional regulator [Lacrimispora aerotolerans]|uniref:TetR/AcrR family transcriptional regulator n=1 Tax=Lacrimispora aerotolerans TaxID=36832 RepID=UPI00047A248D|nr:TetR/AcrR family transcriptional regulator [Lacrimispora aerotolerans]
MNDKKSGKGLLTKKAIADTYLAMIPSNMWDKITVKEICKTAGVTRGTFYLYYNDIYDLMEQIETSLLTELAKRYSKISKENKTSPFFEDLLSFDVTPPAMFLTWFDFCKDYKGEMIALLDRKNGDSYFRSKLKQFLSIHINHLMDRDGLPQDGLRTHFTKILLELHLTAAQTWLEQGEDEFLSTEEIVNLLNTMRVGAIYLSCRKPE